MTRNRLATICIVLAAFAAKLSASTIWSDTLTNGAPPEWQTNRGSWSWTSAGLGNAAAGENRIFTVLPADLKDTQIGVTATLKSGSGWGLFFGSQLSPTNAITGYTFQYDPGYGTGAYLLRQWTSDKESVLLPVISKLDFGVAHRFEFTFTDTSFLAFQDGKEVLSYKGSLSPSDTLAGFRTWGSSQAVFSDFTVGSGYCGAVTPEPATACLLLVGTLLFRRRQA